MKLHLLQRPTQIGDWVGQHWRPVALFVVGSNLLFTGADVFFAHQLDQPLLSTRWIPIYYSLIGGPFLIILGFLTESGALARLFHQLLLGQGALVGIVGFTLHLTHGSGDQALLKSLVYSAPIAAPLAYAGISLFGLAVLESEQRLKLVTRAQLLMLLVSGGFAGNAVLSILDHAQNHFFHPMEWIPVVASLFATFHCFLMALKSRWTDTDRGLLFGTLWMQVLFGVVGFVLHGEAGLDLPAADGVARFFYGAPLFAPLLLANVAVYGMLTLLLPPSPSKNS